MYEPKKPLAVALDIGTTTIQGSLIDLRKKKILSYFSSLNEQLSIGHDIISRIKFCLERPDGLQKLHRKIISSINHAIKNLLNAAKENRDNISYIAAVGNTAMYHFTLSLSPEKLTEPPYQPEYKDSAKRNAPLLGIEANRECEFNFLPNIGGFVGSDAIGVILATGMDRSKTPMLAVDIGTNGEIALGCREKILVASTAAGPAFEGWHIGCGMRAKDGAIESVEDIRGRLRFKVIGDIKPEGISGSGLIDIIAILFRRGEIDRSGRIRKDFIVYENGKKISITQEDVRQVQLAKAAFSVAVNFLRRSFKKGISKFFITGNFGNYINKDNAKTIGIIPQDIDLNRVEFLKDGALKGAQIFINNRDSTMDRIKTLLNKTEHVSLAQDKAFQREFAEATRF